MDRIEIREMLLKKKLFPTYKEWYEMNKTAFELVHNNRDPFDVYEEYMEEEITNWQKILDNKR